MSLPDMPLVMAGDNPKTNHHSRNSASFFISGHSLTDNPYADYLVQITSSFGVQSEYNQQIVIGSPIRVRTRGNDPNGRGFPGYKLGKNREGSGMEVLAEFRDRNTIKAENYDYLIITERHDLVTALVWEGTDKYLRHYRNQFMMRNDGRVYFFVPWLGRNNLQDINSWVIYEESALRAWECIIAKVNRDLIREQSSPIDIIPANIAVVELVKRVLSDSVVDELRYRSDADRLALLFSDDVHLTKLGIYYIALVTYALVFNSSPEGAWFPDEINKEMALYLQDTASKFVSNKVTSIPGPDLTRCGTLFVESFCNVYWDYVGQRQHTQSCRRYFASQNKSSLFYTDDK
jgi:hypothetical protein